MENLWTLNTQISFDGESFGLYHKFSPKAYLSTRAWSPLELTTILHAIGSGKLCPREESMEEFLARGGVIQKISPRAVQESGIPASPKNLHRMSLDELLKDI